MYCRMKLGAALLAVTLVVMPALAADLTPSPAGTWVSADGQTKVKVTLCGDGTQLCAKLTGLSGRANTAKNVQLLNHYVVDRADKTSDSSWKGVVHFNGETAIGNIELVSMDTITLSGCQLGMCKSFQFNRI